MLTKTRSYLGTDIGIIALAGHGRVGIATTVEPVLARTHGPCQARLGAVLSRQTRVAVHTRVVASIVAEGTQGARVLVRVLSAW